MIRRNPIAANSWKRNRCSFIPDKKKEELKQFARKRVNRDLDEYED